MMIDSGRRLGYAKIWDNGQAGLRLMCLIQSYRVILKMVGKRIAYEKTRLYHKYSAMRGLWK